MRRIMPAQGVAFALELVGTLLASGLRRSLGGALDVYAAVVRVFATWVVNAATGRPICPNIKKHWK